MRLNVDYKTTDTNMTTFYKFFSTYGSIEYETSSGTYVQKGDFEEIKSKKTTTEYVYIGVNDMIQNAEHIKLILNVRDSVYEYVLK